MKNIKNKNASYWIALICALLLISTPLMVIYNPEIGWDNVAWAMIVWGTIGFFTGITNYEGMGKNNL